MTNSDIVLILGSGPNAVQLKDWPRHLFGSIVAINNAWQVRPDWDYLIHPEDFDPARMPPAVMPGQKIITAQTYVPAIMTAPDSAYKAQRHRIHHGSKYPTSIKVLRDSKQ